VIIAIFAAAVMGDKPAHGPKLKRAERHELERLRELRDDLLTKSLDNMDVELFAREVYETIRTKNKEINK
jgi:hypothetical protein